MIGQSCFTFDVHIPLAHMQKLNLKNYCTCCGTDEDLWPGKIYRSSPRKPCIPSTASHDRAQPQACGDTLHTLLEMILNHGVWLTRLQEMRVRFGNHLAYYYLGERAA